jgi:anti-anti-sigma factor
LPQASRVPSSSVGPFSVAPPFGCTLTAGASRAAWVHVSGELDLLTSSQLEDTLREAQLHARLVVLDARDVCFIDTAGIHVIVDAIELSDWGGAPLVLLASPAVEAMLTVVGLREPMPTLSDTSAAVATRL